MKIRNNKIGLKFENNSQLTELGAIFKEEVSPKGNSQVFKKITRGE